MPESKPVNYSLIPPGHEIHGMLLDLVRRYHLPRLAEAALALVWRYGLQPDKDGRLELARCRKVSDADKELAAFDFVLFVNFDAWERFTEGQKRALLDHQLTHCSVSLDAEGNPKLDERGRTCYRVRKHDVEEFREVVERHGCWTEDLERFAKTALQKSKLPLFERNGHAGDVSLIQFFEATGLSEALIPPFVAHGVFTLAELEHWLGQPVFVPGEPARFNRLSDLLPEAKAKKVARAVEEFRAGQL